MRLTLLSRASDLAQIQSVLVQHALEAAHPGLEITRLTRESAGDRRVEVALSALGDKGVFTADLSDALVDGVADIVVHSWKDLPTEGRRGTAIAGALGRADPRDVLILAPGTRARRPHALTVLTSSPRRTWMLETSLADLLPWPVASVRGVPVRGNVPTRLRKLREGAADGLVVAKAALDRLLGAGDLGFPGAARAVRESLADCDWMVLPLRRFPTAPAQGALAIEVAARRPDVRAIVDAVVDEPTRRDVEDERGILTAFGGGCHTPLGATILSSSLGRVISVRSHRSGVTQARWELDRPQALPPSTTEEHLWPGVSEAAAISRGAPACVSTPILNANDGLFVTRVDAWQPSLAGEHLVWAAGDRTWKKLAAAGVWVHGSAEGLGETLAPDIDALAGRSIQWRRLTHADAAIGDRLAIAVYEIDRSLPADLAARTHFFWSSPTEFTEAIARFPEIRGAWHASGPGRTRRVLEATLGNSDHLSVWLDIQAWRAAVTGSARSG